MATPATKKTAFLDPSHPGWCLGLFSSLFSIFTPSSTACHLSPTLPLLQLKIHNKVVLLLVFLPSFSIFYFEVANLAILVVIWDLFLAVPFSIFLVWLNKVVIRSIGLAAFLTSERGLLMSKVVFAVTNAACVCMWAIQLNLEAKNRKKEYLAQLKRDIEEWEDEIERLEKVKEVSLLSLILSCK